MSAAKWAIDHSTDNPILTYENCSVIQDEQAHFVLGLIQQLPLIQTALEHASFALDGVVALDDEDMGKDGGSATAQHTKRTVDRALKALRALTDGGHDV